MTENILLELADEDTLKTIERTPPDPLKALEAEYEIALKGSVEYLSGRSSAEMDEREKNIVQRLARHFLFNYYMGFAIAKFIAPYRDEGTPTARQHALEGAIQKLAYIEPARELMTECFAAALEGRLHRILREWMDAGKFTLHPRRALGRTAARIGLADDWETLGQVTENALKTLHFGLGGFYLIFESTGTIRPCEFKVLMRYLQRITTFRQLQDAKIPNHIDVVRVLVVPALSSDQQDELIGFVLSLLDLNRFPSSTYENIEDPIARAKAVIDDMGFSRNLTTFLRLPLRIKRVQAWLREEEERSRETYQMLHPHPEQEELAHRRWLVAELLSILTVQSDQALQMLEQENLAFSSSILFSAFKRPSLMKHLDLYFRTNRWNSLPGEKELQKSNASLDMLGMQFLIGIIRQQEEHAQWAGQILENIPALRVPAARWLITVLQTEENPAVLRAVMRLHENFAQRQSLNNTQWQLSNNLKNALINRVINLVNVTDVPLDPQWINWLINLGQQDEPLQRMLVAVANALASETLPARTPRYVEALRLIASQAEQVKNPDAVTLAACWLVDPDDWIEDKRPLIERIKEATTMLGASGTDENTQKRVVSILEHAIPKEPPSITSDQLNEIARKEGDLAANYVQEHPMLAPIFAEPLHLFPESKREGADKRLAVAKALGKIHYPHLALPLLENLLQLALEMEQAWKSSRYTEFSYEARQIARETLKSIAMLKPLTVQAVLLIQKTLMASRTHESPLNSELHPDFIHELMPLLTHEVSSEAVPVLIELVWRNHCGPLINDESPCVRRDEPVPLKALEHPSLQLTIGEKIHRYLHIYEPEGYYAEGMILLCALQALANVTDLTLPQQQIIWRVYRSSWHALTKSLCLLILGRQRPVREETVRELVRVLRQDPTVAFLKTIIKYLFRSLLFRLFYRMSPPEPDLNYTYLCQTIAVNRVGTLLKEERRSPIVRKHHRALEKALLATTSLFRCGMETRVDLSMAASGAKGMMRLMGATQSEEEQTTWMARPADRAYQVLQNLQS
ncbi:MAG: hypothetical protein WBW48_17290 [Anaerolineae bacterium]